MTVPDYLDDEAPTDTAAVQTAIDAAAVGLDGDDGFTTAGNVPPS